MGKSPRKKIQQLRLQKVEEEGVLASWQTEKKRSNAVMAELEAEIKERALLNKNIISQKAALKERIVTLEQEIELCVEKNKYFGTGFRSFPGGGKT